MWAVQKRVARQMLSHQRMSVSFAVKASAPKSDSDFLAEKLSKIQATPACYIPANEPKQPANPTFIARKTNIAYSSHKLAACAAMVKGMNLYDALAVIERTNKKGGPLVKSVLEAARVNASKQAHSLPDRLWVKTITVGRAQGPKTLDIKGRGKQGIIRAPKSSMRLIVEEKSAQDMYKLVL